MQRDVEAHSVGLELDRVLLELSSQAMMGPVDTGVIVTIYAILLIAVLVSNRLFYALGARAALNSTTSGK